MVKVHVGTEAEIKQKPDMYNGGKTIAKHRFLYITLQSSLTQHHPYTVTL